MCSFAAAFCRIPGGTTEGPERLSRTSRVERLKARVRSNRERSAGGFGQRKETRLRRRKIDGCPIAGALQLIGDKWTMLVVRDLCAGPKRTTELLEDLHPISSRTLMGRLREMEQDELILRNNYGGLPRRVEYELTERGRRLIPLLDALMKTGQALDCNECEDRKESAGYYCDFCPLRRSEPPSVSESPLIVEPAPERIRRPKDDSIVLL
jgi:DNA-binding HxlR family transcriptional regulator